MRTVSIFLASSMNDLQEERLAIAADFASLNDLYLDKGVARLKLVRAEAVSDRFAIGGKQGILNDKVCNADAVFFLFASHVGRHTKEELNHAFECFLRTGKPRIYACLKTNVPHDETIEALRDELRSLKQYYYPFERASDISAKIHQAVDRIIFDEAPVEAGNHEMATAEEPVMPRRRETVTVVDSSLAVVHPFIKGAEFEKVFPDCRIRYVKRSWGRPSIDYCESGRGHFCVANRRDFEEYQRRHPDTNLINIGTVCHSMGGRNLAVITRKDSRFAQVTLDNIDEGLREAQITVGLDTDRYRGLMTVLGVRETWFGEHDVTLIDIADPHLQIFDMNKDAIAVAGQNVRLEAIESGDFIELFPFTQLSKSTQHELLANSENILLAREDLLERLEMSASSIHGKLRENFNAWSSYDRIDDFVEDLADECKFDSDDSEVREKLLRITLYETYRFGMPVLL